MICDNLVAYFADLSWGPSFFCADPCWIQIVFNARDDFFRFFRAGVAKAWISGSPCCPACSKMAPKTTQAAPIVGNFREDGSFAAVLVATLVMYADKFLSIICYTEQWAAVTRGWD